MFVGCSSTAMEPTPKALRGPDTPRFERAKELLAAAARGNVSCTNQRPFNPIANVAHDGIDYPVPNGRVCDLPSGEPLYVIVYDTLEHRLEAFNKGEVNLNLCSFARSTTHAASSWNSLVAGNWRAATPAGSRALAALDTALGGGPEVESLSCMFRS